MAAESSVLIVIVNWNGRHHLETCLPGLFDSNYRERRVVVIDNGSSDGSREWLQANFPEVERVELGGNRGFAPANNIGLEMALAGGAAYAALLNNDTRVEPDWLRALVETAEADPTIAICQARQRTWDGEREIRFRFVPAWCEAEASQTDVTPAGSPTATPFASGCAMLIRCSALRRIGLFDPRYFMYVEDVDLTLRAWIAGYRVMDVPEAVVYHRFSGSATTSRQRMYLGYRNQLTTLLKLYEADTLSRFSGAIGGRWISNRGAWRGTLDALAMLPGTLTRRRRVQAGRRARDAAFLDLVSG